MGYSDTDLSNYYHQSEPKTEKRRTAHQEIDDAAYNLAKAIEDFNSVVHKYDNLDLNTGNAAKEILLSVNLILNYHSSIQQVRALLHHNVEVAEKNEVLIIKTSN